jgi:hypothetical protein
MRIMMDMLDPDKSEFEKLPDFNELLQVQLETLARGSQQMDKHFAMALQQMKLLNMVTEFLKENGADVTSQGTPDEQRKVMNHFSHMLEE